MQCQKDKNNQQIKNLIKKTENTTNNAVNTSIFNRICKDFVDWVNGIQEDEPLKTEAKNIYFLLEYKQNDFVFSYSADEKILQILDYGAYFPLEAEYLYSSALKELANDVFQNKTLSKLTVLTTLKKVVISNLHKFDFFDGHNVYFGIRLSKNQAKNCLAKL